MVMKLSGHKINWKNSRSLIDHVTARFGTRKQRLLKEGTVVRTNSFVNLLWGKVSIETGVFAGESATLWILDIFFKSRRNKGLG